MTRSTTAEPREIPESDIPIQSEPKDIPNRLTVVESVYYQEIGEPIYQYDTRYHVSTQEKEQPVFEQRLRATPDWKPLNFSGWQDIEGNPITRCSMLIIRNEEGRSLHKIPTEEEKQETARLVIELGQMWNGAVIPCWEVQPTTTFRGRPTELANLVIRCPNGLAKFTLILIPA